MTPQPSYLGDGAYVSHDGYHVVLTTGTHDRATADNIVYLDPQVLQKLIDWLLTNEIIKNNK